MNDIRLQNVDAYVRHLIFEKFGSQTDNATSDRDLRREGRQDRAAASAIPTTDRSHSDN